MSTPLDWLRRAVGTAFGRRYPFALCYHGVGSITDERDPHGLFVSRDLFECHLDVIQSQGYQLLPVGELWTKIDEDPQVTHIGSITFDDGLVSTANEAVPVLRQRGLSCSMFISTGLIGCPHPDLGGQMILSASEIIELDRMGVEIGAHTVDHVNLASLTYEDVLDQLRRSRATLEDLLGKSVKTMAYPYGALSKQIICAAHEAGYEVACGCSGPGPWRAFNIPRDPIYPTATPLRLRLKIAGLYGPALAIRSIKLPLQRVGS